MLVINNALIVPHLRLLMRVPRYILYCHYVGTGKYLIVIHSDESKRLRLLWQCNNRARKPAGSRAFILYITLRYIKHVVCVQRAHR